MGDVDLKKIRALLETTEKVMSGGKRVLDLGALAKSRVEDGKCAVCGQEDAVANSPLGATCAKRGASILIDLIGRGGG